MRLAFLLVVGFLAGAPAWGQPTTQRILFIGNSLTTSSDIPARLEKLAAALGRTAIVGTVAEDNATLEDHWRAGKALAEIRKGWDVVVLQGGASAREREELPAVSKRFAEAIREAKAKPAHLMVWPAQDRMKDFPAVIAAHREASEATQSILLPVGEAWLRALSAERRLRLYSGSSHPAALGSDLAAITIYLALFPAGHQEFDEAFVARAAKALGLPADSRDLLFDAATRAIDEPMALK